MDFGLSLPASTSTGRRSRGSVSSTPSGVAADSTRDIGGDQRVANWQSGSGTSVVNGTRPSHSHGKLQESARYSGFRLPQDLRTPELHGHVVRDVGATIDKPSPSQPDNIGHDQVIHVLFFDGGSRDNPGPGGSGACVTRVDPLTGTGTILCSAAMSHAHPATTNNQAEYQGLITGLRAAHQNKWLPLEVVGDSALILQQLRSYRKPKNLCLFRLYAIARRLADLPDVRRWKHHPRASNKMADSLANHAMDQRRSSRAMHPTARTGHANVDALLSNDLRPWFAASSGD